MNTSTTPRVQHHHDDTVLALCDNVTLEIVAHRWVPAEHPRYTCAQYSEKAVGGSTVTSHTRAPRGRDHDKLAKDGAEVDAGAKAVAKALTINN